MPDFRNYTVQITMVVEGTDKVLRSLAKRKYEHTHFALSIAFIIDIIIKKSKQYTLNVLNKRLLLHSHTFINCYLLNALAIFWHTLLGYD